MLKTIKYIAIDILKSRFINAYLFFLFMLSMGLFYFTDDPEKGILGVSNVILVLVPLVCIIFTTTNIYNSVDFIRLLLTQPVSRATVFFSHYIAIVSSLLYAFILGTGIPVLLYSGGSQVLTILFTGVIITIVFSSVSFLISWKVKDRVKGIGLNLFTWLYFIAIYDGLMMIIIKAMSDYPVEQYTILLALLNPIDMCRILVMFTLDISALMGLTGTVLQAYLGTVAGTLIIYTSLLLWVLVPLFISRRIFLRRDF
jgi:Cu-processing system permease protein